MTAWTALVARSRCRPKYRLMSPSRRAGVLAHGRGPDVGDDLASPGRQPRPLVAFAAGEEVAPPPPAIVNPLRAPSPRSAHIHWWSFLTGIYSVVAGVLLLRLAIGLALTWRMARAAQPIRENWTGGADVRVSDVVGVPVTVGSTVLLPPEYVHWSPAKLRAVLSHEGSHRRPRRFHVLPLAAINRGVLVQPVRLVAAGAAGRARGDHQRRRRAEFARGPAVLRVHPARRRRNAGRAPAAIAMAAGQHSGPADRAHPRRAATPARMGLGQTRADRGGACSHGRDLGRPIAFGVAPSRDDVVAPGTPRPGSQCRAPVRQLRRLRRRPEVLPDCADGHARGRPPVRAAHRPGQARGVS